MKPKIVSYTFDTLPPVTEADEARLQAPLAARPDSEIDTSDIPEASEEAWRYPFRLPEVLDRRKRTVTTRIDIDVLDWLESQDKNIHPHINDILRREMLAASQRPKTSGEQEDTAA